MNRMDADEETWDVIFFCVHPVYLRLKILNRKERRVSPGHEKCGRRDASATVWRGTRQPLPALLVREADQRWLGGLQVG